MSLRFKDWEFPDDLYYDTSHQWVRLNGKEAVVGITSFGQYLMGDVVYLDLPRPGSLYKQGEACGSVESGKWVGRIFAPLGGKITRVNEEVLASPSLINTDPYGKGWLFALRYDDEREVTSLLRGPSYLAWVREEAEREGIEGGEA